MYTVTHHKHGGIHYKHRHKQEQHQHVVALAHSRERPLVRLDNMGLRGQVGEAHMAACMGIMLVGLHGQAGKVYLVVCMGKALCSWACMGRQERRTWSCAWTRHRAHGLAWAGR